MEAQEPQQDKNPEDMGPFKRIRNLGRNKVQVEPDPKSIKTVITMEEKPGYLAQFRRWVLRNHVQVYALFMIIFVISYEAPAHYYPLITNTVVAITALAIFLTFPVAYEWELKRDKANNVIVDEIRLSLKETTVGRQKGPDGIQARVLISDITRRAIYLAKSYMFDKTHPKHLEMRGAQIVDTGWGKIVDVEMVDDTGRILIGSGDGDLPAGIVLKIAYPSRNELTKEVANAEKLMKDHALSYQDFIDFKRKVYGYNKFRDMLWKDAAKKGFGLIDMDKLSKKQKSFFIALDKYSLPFWDPKGVSGLSDWMGMPSGIRLPKVLMLQKAYDEVKNEKIDLILTRESDKQDAKVESIIDVLDSLSVTENMLRQFGVQRKESLGSKKTGTEKELEERMEGAQQGE